MHTENKEITDTEDTMKVPDPGKGTSRGGAKVTLSKQDTDNITEGLLKRLSERSSIRGHQDSSSSTITGKTESNTTTVPF